LQAALRRIIESVWLYVVPDDSMNRYSAAQVWSYKSRAKPFCRTYFIHHRYSKTNNQGWRREGGWRVCSFAETADQIHPTAHIAVEPKDYDPVLYFAQVDGFASEGIFEAPEWHPLPNGQGEQAKPTRQTKRRNKQAK
jgi:hypothetical protein